MIFFSESIDEKAKSHNSKTLHFRDKKAKKAQRPASKGIKKIALGCMKKNVLNVKT